MIAFFTGMPGIPEMLIVAFIVLLLFGKRLPDLMRSLGRSVVEFKKGVNENEDDEQSSPADPDRLRETHHDDMRHETHHDDIRDESRRDDA